ncbi:hypothetical protein RJ639_028758 [Escallonia herrerae]|uniref:O-acyltransferase WSD1 C-terminal domain-containing protein n=1 Tax=Escallonia herrerae TaxID=1293975 RepID=A0AA88X5W2_9ASTE|nr:hypothetical protein RJ639_028758 [Escallonia herrerae]
MTISNMIGPVEQMLWLAIHFEACTSWWLAFHSLTITMMSYMKRLRVAIGTEKGHIDPQRFESCVENAFDMMLKAAAKS